MRKIHSQQIRAIIIAVLLGAGTAASAQVVDQNATIILPNTSSSYNQNGFNLPSAPPTIGQDSIRGSGGLSCQSAIGSGGPKLDMGMIGSNDIFDRNSASVYGRITIPLGKRPKRIDCTKLYDLEIERLRMEIKMMKMGIGVSQLDGPMPAMVQAQASPPQEEEPSSSPFILGGAPAQAISEAQIPAEISDAGNIGPAQ